MASIFPDLPGNPGKHLSCVALVAECFVPHVVISMVVLCFKLADKVDVQDRNLACLPFHLGLLLSSYLLLYSDFKYTDTAEAFLNWNDYDVKKIEVILQPTIWNQ
jgi:hypothetical protein